MFLDVDVKNVQRTYGSITAGSKYGITARKRTSRETISALVKTRVGLHMQCWNYWMRNYELISRKKSKVNTTVG